MISVIDTRRGRPAATPHHSTLPYKLLAIVVALAAAYDIGLTVSLIPSFKTDVPYFTLQPGSARVSGAATDAIKDGIRRGDALLTVNGRAYTGTAVLSQEKGAAVPGESLLLTFQAQDGALRTVVLPVTGSRHERGAVAVPVLMLIVIPLVCLALGCWVVLVRPSDRLAWLLLAMLLGFTHLFGANERVESWSPGVREAAMALHMGIASAWPIFMYLFGFYFPEPFPQGSRMLRWAKWGRLILVPCLISGVIDTIVSTGQISDYAAVASLVKVIDPLQGILQAFEYLAISGFFCFIFVKSSGQSGLPADAQRRLRLLYWGTAVSMTPVLILSVVATVRKTAFELMPQWITYPSLLLLLLFPLTLAYVIVVQRAMDVRVVVRQGLQYGLAKTGIRVLQFAAIAIVIATAFAMGSNKNTFGKVVVIAMAVTIGLMIPRLGERLKDWTDRRFFREAYNAEQVLSDLSDQVRSMVETRPLIETVAARISETLHIPQVAVLLGADGTYHPAYALGYNTVPTVNFLSSAGTAKVLRAQQEPARVYFDDPDSWVYRDPGVSEEERAKLAQLHAELLLPLSTRDKLLGFISLGPKRSDEPYSGSDVRLLKSVAAQTGLALENARLMSAIADEVAQRERLNREVEIAREVQERLFPQKLPPILGVDYAGACRPALGVGGDYYDFLALPGGQLGIAVGDVSGKGIAAALMMASLQASLRGEATRAPENLAALVTNVNRLVYEASSSNRYATFFYAQYNPECRQLTYVNAGHNPPMLFHRSAGTWTISRLEAGGTVVGLLESFPYEQSSLKIEPGDVFIAFTDGISEAMNNADEEWGEDRMVEAVKSCANMSPSEMIGQIMQAADKFVAGAKQHDDMTLVVLRSTQEAS